MFNIPRGVSGEHGMGHLADATYLKGAEQTKITWWGRLGRLPEHVQQGFGQMRTNLPASPWPSPLGASPAPSPSPMPKSEFWFAAALPTVLSQTLESRVSDAACFHPDLSCRETQPAIGFPDRPPSPLSPPLFPSWGCQFNGQVFNSSLSGAWKCQHRCTSVCGVCS